MRVLIPALFLTLALLLGACGDYDPCDVMARRICTECPSVAEHWQAACLCLDKGSLKEKGYKCMESSKEDEIRCNATLENWDEDTCAQMN